MGHWDIGILGHWDTGDIGMLGNRKHDLKQGKGTDMLKEEHEE